MYVASTVQKLVSARISDAMAAGRLPDGYGGLLKLGDDIVIQRRAEMALALSGAEGVTWGAGDTAGATGPISSSTPGGCRSPGGPTRSNGTT